MPTSPAFITWQHLGLDCQSSGRGLLYALAAETETGPWRALWTLGSQCVSKGNSVAAIDLRTGLGHRVRSGSVLKPVFSQSSSILEQTLAALEQWLHSVAVQHVGSAGRGPWFESQLFHHVPCLWVRQVAFSKDCSELSRPHCSSRMWPFPQQEIGFMFPPLKGGCAYEHGGSDVLCCPRPGLGRECNFCIPGCTIHAMWASKHSETAMLWGSLQTTWKGPETTRRDAWLTPSCFSLLVLTILFLLHLLPSEQLHEWTQTRTAQTSPSSIPNPLTP